MVSCGFCLHDQGHILTYRKYVLEYLLLDHTSLQLAVKLGGKEGEIKALHSANQNIDECSAKSQPQRDWTLTGAFYAG